MDEHQSTDARGTVSRRSALKALSTGAGALAVWPYLSDTAAEAFAAIQASGAPPKPVFLSPAQYATVDALTEAIIPSDDDSPGAHEARVADYLDLLLSESDGELQQAWLAGLALVDQEAVRRFGSPFATLVTAQSAEVLTAMSTNEADPQTPLEQFFRTTKDAAIRGYYTSEIGIHKALGYKGNQLLGEFLGCTHPEHGYESRD